MVETNQVVGRHLVVQTAGKERDLLTIVTCDEAHHPDLLHFGIYTTRASCFLHSLQSYLTFGMSASRQFGGLAVAALGRKPAGWFW